jgi:RimJ/RimL family protein N-acetyltransferase
MHHFTPTSLKDGFVTVRPWQDDDAESLVARINDQDVARYLDQVPQPYRLEDAREFFALSDEGWRTGTMTNFAVLVDGIDGPAGGVGLRWEQISGGVAEVGYWVAAEARGRGTATAVARLVSRWAFGAEPTLQRIELRAAVENPASNRVAEKAGFTREGVLRSQRYNARLGRRTDFVMWSLLREEV